jgi:hypothetical protein
MMKAGVHDACLFSYAQTFSVRLLPVRLARFFVLLLRRAAASNGGG